MCSYYVYKPIYKKVVMSFNKEGLLLMVSKKDSKKTARTAVFILRILMVVAVLVILSGVFLMRHYSIERATDRSETIADMGETRLVTAFFDDHYAVVGFASDRLIKVDPSGNELWRHETEGSVRSIKLSNNTGHIFVAIEGPEVFSLDREGNLIASAEVRGRSMTLYYNEEAGKVAVVHGVGVTSDRFFVTTFDEQLNLIGSFQTFFDTNAVAVTSDGMFTFFGTVDSRIGAMDADGNWLWEVLAKFSVQAMELVEERNLLIVADDRGFIQAISYAGERGRQVWEYALEDVTPTSIAVDTKNEVIVIGCSNGHLHALDFDGYFLMSKLVGGGAINAMTIDYETGSIFGSSGRALFEASYIQNIAVTEVAFGDISIFIMIAGVLLLIISFFMHLYRVSARAHHTMRLMAKGRMAYIMLIPTFSLLAVFVYYPIVTGLGGAFTNWSPHRETEFIGFENFRRIATDIYVWTGVRNMLLLTFTDLLKTLTMPLFAALLTVHLISRRMRYFYRTMIVLTTIVPGVAAALMWRMMLDPNIGLINNVLRSIGLDRFALAWLGEEHLAIWAIIFIGFPWIGVFPFLVYYGGFIGISSEIFDSAKIDGTNAAQRFFRIELPLITPQIKMLLLLGLIGGLQSYQGILLTTRGGPGRSTYVPALEVFFNIAEFGEFGYASAIGLLLFVFILLVSLIILKIPTYEAN